MNVAILTIGDELLLGRTMDRNAAWLGEKLDASGLSVVRTLSVGDDEQAICEALQWAYQAADVVVTTGGLGPTDDDRTREAVASFAGRKLVFQEKVFEQIQRMFAERDRTLPESNRSQAFVPRGFEVLDNPEGTAPGLWYTFPDPDEQFLAVLPGVPSEMKYLYTREVQPRLRQHRDGQVIRHRTIRTAGIGESHLHEKIGDVSDLVGETLQLAFLPSPQGVRLRLSAHGRSENEVSAQLDRLEERLRNRAGKYIYGTGDDTLARVVGRMLNERGLKMAIAESCTGGYVANQITDVSGASSYLRGGLVAYSNAAKCKLLDVDTEVLEEVGAVSEEVACQMAAGVRRRFASDIGLSTTGIAGPTGGTPEKPVGTVWIGYAHSAGTEACLLHLVKDRHLNKALTSTALLHDLRRRLLERETAQPA